MESSNENPANSASMLSKFHRRVLYFVLKNYKEDKSATRYDLNKLGDSKYIDAFKQISLRGFGFITSTNKFILDELRAGDLLKNIK